AGVASLYTAFASDTPPRAICAIANPAALVSDDYYREATRHDRRIEAAANGRAAGAKVTVETEPSGTSAAVLRMSPAHHGRAVGRVTWYRPSDASFDRTMPLAIDDDGVQRMAIGDLPGGHWRIK